MPGARSGDIYDRAVLARAELGLELTTSHVGHGIGLEFQEMPLLRRVGSDALAPAMVLVAVSVVPDAEAGYLYIEDMIEIEADGARLLSDYIPTEVPVLIDP